MMRVTVLCITLFVVGSFGAPADKCHLENLNDCGEPLLEFRKDIGQRFPTSEDQVDELCKRLDEAEKCLKKFKSQCMTPMQVQLMEMMTEGGYEVSKEFCTSGSEIRTDYLHNAECMNEAYESEEYKEFASYLEAGMEDLMEKPQNEQLPAACCGYQWLESNSKKLGTEKCGADAVNSFSRVASMAASNLPEIMCQGFDPEGDQCTKLLPAPGTKPKGTIRNSHLGQSFASLYLDE